MNKLMIAIMILLPVLYAPDYDSTADDKKDYERFEALWNGILMTESDNLHFKRWKIVSSPVGAIGIAQVMSNTFLDVVRWNKNNKQFKHLKIRHLHIKKYNLMVGKWYFSNSYFTTNRTDETRAISSYNRGINSDIIATKYVKKVRKYASIYTR